MTLPRIMVAAAAALAAAIGGSTAAAPAAAAPSNGNTFVLDLSCSDGQHYPITLVDKAAQPSAAHLLDRNSVLIPTAFQFHIVVLDSVGRVVEEVTPPPQIVRGRSGEHHETMSCTFAQTHNETLAGVGEVTIRLEGTVHAHSPH